MCNKDIKIGDVYWVRFESINENRRGRRPAVIFQNDKGNHYSPNVAVLPLTSVLRKIEFPTHVFIPKEVMSTNKDSIVLCENPTCVSKEQLDDFICHLPVEYIQKIAECSILASSAIAYLNQDQIYTVWRKSATLNPVF